MGDNRAFYQLCVLNWICLNILWENVHFKQTASCGTHSCLYHWLVPPGVRFEQFLSYPTPGRVNDCSIPQMNEPLVS